VANEFITAEQVVAQALGVLERDTVLAQFTWRDFANANTFRGAKNDTVTLRVPAFMEARTRVMRSATAIVVDDLSETSVDVTLDTHVYKAVGVTDEEMTLNITDFGEQVTGPAMASVVRRVDTAVGAEMAAASPEVSITIDEDDPFDSIVDARTALNLHSVPADGRFLAVGSNVENRLLKSDHLNRFDASGSSEALREAIIGRIAGFTAVTAIGRDPDVAIAAHRTAFPLALVAPVVPAGASWGTTMTYRGLQLRVLRDYDPTGSSGPVDRLLTDTFMGTGTTLDRGTIDADGRFVPSVDGDDDPILVRAVKLELASS
jgi:hypothetical protein